MTALMTDEHFANWHHQMHLWCSLSKCSSLISLKGQFVVLLIANSLEFISVSSFQTVLHQTNNEDIFKYECSHFSQTKIPQQQFFQEMATDDDIIFKKRHQGTEQCI